MSGLQEQTRHQCISCGINVAGSNAARFDCPECNYRIYRCAKCRKQSNLYQCKQCGFTGP